MTMKDLEYGMPMEDQIPPPSEGGDSEPGDGAAQAPEVSETGQAGADDVPAEPVKKKRTVRKKADKAPEEADGAESTTKDEEVPAPEPAPASGELPEDDQLAPVPGALDNCDVVGLAEPSDEQPSEPEAGVSMAKPDVEDAAPSEPPAAAERSRTAGPRGRVGRPAEGHSPLMSLKLNELDRDLTDKERQEWNDIYASFRSKSVLTGRIIGVDGQAFNVRNRETGQVERRTMYCAVIIAYRVKVLIPETEMWMPGEERPTHVLRNMSGAEIDYVILDVDREGGVAIASRRMGAMIKQRAFDTARGGHDPGEKLSCRVLTVGPSRCLVECGGRDITLRYQDMSYASYSDLREKYHPGETLDCVLKEFSRASGNLVISVKEASPHPFEGVQKRHPLGSRRQAVISGKYAGGVFCTMPDDTTCLCLYTAEHTDRDFREGDTVILVIVKYDYERSLVYGRILSKW